MNLIEEFKHVIWELEEIIEGFSAYDEPSPEELELHNNLYNLLGKLKKLEKLI